MTNGEKRQLESMMRIVVAMQGLLDAILFTGQTLLDQPAQANAPRAEGVPQSAGLDSQSDDPYNPRVFNQPRASVPNRPEDGGDVE